MDRLGVHLTHECGDVLPPPVVDIHGFAESRKGLPVSERSPGIPDEVKVDRVDIIPPDKIECDGGKVRTHFRPAGVEPELAVLLDGEGCQRARGVFRCAGAHGIRSADFEHIEPGMDFNTQLMCFSQNEGERVPAGIFAERAGEILRPGLIARTIIGIAAGADLKEHRVEPGGLDPAQQGAQGRLLFNPVCCLRPVEPGCGGYPHCTDFGFWRRDGKRRLRSRVGGNQERQREDENKAYEHHAVVMLPRSP